jgi:phosphatidylserine/phosphatidylglycerophosphate/cardiolipin synthase-like enzyme
MNSGNLETFLQQTIEDYRLSRSERRVLGDALSQVDGNPQELAFLLSRAFDIARQNTVDPETRGVIDWLEDLVKVARSAESEDDDIPRPEALFSPDDNCSLRICNMIQRARHSADLCVFTITDDRITNTLLDAHRRGLEVRVISDNDKSLDLGSDIQRLSAAGIPVRIDRTEHHMHNKFGIFDNLSVLTGSYNWTRSASLFNEENIVILHDKRLTEQFLSKFNKMWGKLG